MSEEEKKQNEEMSLITDMGGILAKNSKVNIYCLSIVGQIEGHSNLPPDVKTTKYEHVIPKLVEVEQDESIDGLLIMLNTVGGDVEAGLAIAEMIASMKTPTVSIVLGGGHSIGVPLAVSADKSFIVPSATMTVHPIRTGGLVIGVHQTFEYLSKVQEQICDFVQRHSKISAENFMSIMLETENIANDVGTVLFGQEAVECGLIDAVGGLGDAVETLRKMKEKGEKQENKNHAG